MTALEIPARLRDRPTLGGFPIPYVVDDRDGAKPGFSFNSIGKVLEAAAKRLCGQCGQPLDYYIAFIGGPNFCAARFFGEPGMHEDCARYALAACPHLASNRVKGLAKTREGVTVLRHGDEGNAAPGKWCLYITRSYKIVHTRTGVPGFKVGTPVRVHWFRAGAEIAA